MPFQPINFAGIKPITPYQGQAMPDVIQEFMQAMRRPQAMQEERQMNQGQIEKQRLANALDKQFGAREREGKLALDEAYKKYYESGPGGMGGRSGLTPALRIWNSSPADVKKEMLSYARGMGYTADEATRRLSGGETLQQMAQEKGVDLNSVEPQQGLTTAGITSLNDLEGQFAEIAVIDRRVNRPIEKYSSGKWFGYSPKQIIDSLKGKDEEVGEYLAALALQPELAGIRTRILKGSNAHEALQEMQEKSFGVAKIIDPTVNEAQLKSMNKHISETINEAVQARKDAMQHFKKRKPEAPIPTEKEMGGYQLGQKPDPNKPGHVLMVKKGKRFSVPLGNVTEALEQGAGYE